MLFRPFFPKHHVLYVVNMYVSLKPIRGQAQDLEVADASQPILP
jgi:hypothetical protein